MLYLLNTPVLTAYGEYRFSGPLSIAQARDVVAHEFVSAIGHAGAAQFLSQLLGVQVETSRRTVAMAPDDRALVLRIKERLPEGVVLNAEQMQGVPYELSLLERLR